MFNDGIKKQILDLETKLSKINCEIDFRLIGQNKTISLLDSSLMDLVHSNNVLGNKVDELKIDVTDKLKETDKKAHNLLSRFEGFPNFKEQEESIGNLGIIIRTEISNIAKLKEDYKELAIEFHHYREETNLRIKKLNSLIEEKLDSNKEGTDLLFIKLEQAFEDKLNSISDSKPLITDLLQKIAKLEGITDAIGNRRSTEDILGSLQVLNDKMLKNDREEKDITVLKEQVRILKWVLGEDI